MGNKRAPLVAIGLALTFLLAGCGSGAAKTMGKAKTAHPAAKLAVHKKGSTLDAAQVATAKQARLRPFSSVPVHYKGVVVVLMDHAIGVPEHGDTISQARFRAEMQGLLASGYNFLTLQQFDAFLLDGAPIPPNAVLLTFDDGIASVYTGAYPVLKELRIPASAFLIVGRIGNHGALDWQEIETMQKSGLVEFGSHTYALHHGAATSASTSSAATVAHVYSFATRKVESDTQYKKRVGGDLARARSVLRAHLGTGVTAFAYPFGAYDPELIALLKEDGYKVAFTTYGVGTSAKTPPLRVGRINAGTPRLDAKSLVRTVGAIGLDEERDPLNAAPKAIVPKWK